MKNLCALIVALFFMNGAMGQTDQPCSTCLPQGITFTTQSQIDNFQTNYPGCTEILGYVNIGDYISNLNGLSVLTSIDGDLTVSHNNFLISLTGLDNLNTIGESLTISFNGALTSLTALEDLNFVGEDLSIMGIDLLANLSGLGGLTTVPGHLNINGNNSLTSLEGLDNLTSIGGGVIIGFVGWGGGNPSLTSLTGLGSLSYIGDGLYIGANTILTNLTGLESLISIGDALYIAGNDSLTSLTGLENLTFIGGSLVIEDNDALTNLTGIDSVDSNTISQMNIYNNSSLSSCAVQSICNYLANPSSLVLIVDNATGCNSNQEVEDACAALGDEFLSQETTLVIYPNPSTTTITIENPAKGFLVIHNASGQKLLQQEITEPTITIDVSGWKSGVYLVKVVGEKGVSVGKFVKQ